MPTPPWEDEFTLPDAPRSLTPPPNHLLAVCQEDMRRVIGVADPDLPQLVKEILAAARLAVAEGDFKAAHALYKHVIDCRGGTQTATQSSVHQHVHLHQGQNASAADLSLLTDAQLRNLLNASQTAHVVPAGNGST